MRRSRFARAVGSSNEAPDRASISEALWFDIRSADSPGDDALSATRVAALDHCAVLLGFTHLVAWIASLVFHRDSATTLAFSNPLVPLSGLLLLDVAAMVGIRCRDGLGLRPHHVVQALCLYFAMAGTLWIFAGSAMAAQSHAGHPSMPILVLGGGVMIAALVAVTSPPLSAVNLVMIAIGAMAMAQSPVAAAGAALLSLMTLAYSIAGARTMIAAGRQRQNLDAEARKALTFVDEFENSGRGWFWETNAEGTLSYVSQQLADDFECDPKALLGRQFTDLLSVETEAERAVEQHKTLGFHLSARFPFADVVVRAASDRDIHWSLSGNPVFDERGRFLGFRGIGTDLTEQRRSEQEISRLARFDSLTGLPNRALMRKTLDEALRNAARRQKGCALFLIDLDRFKNVNDTHGHPVGDALLRQVAERLKSVMGDHGQVGRLGGDEFMAVLPGNVDVGMLESLARTLIEQVSRPYTIEGHRVSIGASVGIAIGDPGRSCADSLVRNSDLALYAAKAAGRGKHCFYEAAMHSEASDRSVLENDLRQAIDRGELHVAYQPIVLAAGEELSGFEALVRWNHPVRGSISPALFIPLAEECGMIGRIGSWVLDTALAEAAQWPDTVRIAVNLSPIQFNDPTIANTVAELLKKNGVRAERLELEITEGVFLAEGDATDETFSRLKEIGVRLALDDFGTGYSSLGYLKKAPFDKIKIDQSFVRGAASVTSRNSAIIRAIVTLADSLKMDTTAEGVETHDDLHLVRELGCSQIQGYIFGRAVDGEAARAMIHEATVDPNGFQCVREARHRLMRRAIALIEGETREVKLRNISAMGALVECTRPVSPDTQITLDIVGVGPVVGTVRWAHKDRFGLQFTEFFPLSRLAPKKQKRNDAMMMRPYYLDQREAG
ncbi:EAL domain-containing protein [Sphingomonas sp.]|uniref:putative bifunctional diguanylate cyclase/phosphodiesterase n=1 Tax=Sphingomonas sp. TaxID=28214 RepID=UPI00286D8638|nr:EAL domain-containing protein [Sphingomonas sp.]